MPDRPLALGADLSEAAYPLGPTPPSPAPPGPVSTYPVPDNVIPPPPPRATFQSPEGRRRVAEWLILGDLAIKVAYGLVGIGAQLIRTDVLPEPFEGFWTVYEHFGTLMPFVFLCTLLTAGVFFIRWHRQVVRNLTALGCEKLRHGLELASWSWFIPFVTWVVPYQSIAQVARHSRPSGGPNTPALVGLWWAVWLSLGLFNRLTWLLAFLVETVEDWVRTSNFELAVLGIDFIAGMLAILVMRWLTRQQVEHHQRLAAR